MKKTLLTIVAVMFFIFPVMVNASEVDILDKMLKDSHNKLQEAVLDDESTVSADILEQISVLDDENLDSNPLFDGVLTSVADYLPSVSVSVLSSNIDVTGLDIVMLLFVIIGSVTMVLISRKKTVQAN